MRVLMILCFQLLSLLHCSSALAPLFSLGRLAAPFLGKQTASYENGRDPQNFPWEFTGRLWFRPALVRVDDSDTCQLREEDIFVLNVFGYTLGGTVALEYDTSPVGPYREYVSMGALVASRRSSGSVMIGQWGSRLYVSSAPAEKICRTIWQVPAQVARIDFQESDVGSKLQVDQAPNPLDFDVSNPEICLSGWSQTRSANTDGILRGGLPISWTPSIKALWVKLGLPFRWNNGSIDEGQLPLHPLRLSASSLRLHWCTQKPSDDLGIPLGVGLSLDDVLIEIGRRDFNQ